MGRLDLEVDGGIRRFAHELIKVKGEPDPETEELVLKATEKDRDYLEGVVGSTAPTQPLHDNGINHG
ncbi:hypothetical protein [Methanothermobacter wolfeii]|uniref:hypothetical protein n=1 Tax=Methanothermobacter wolfeii TaxID=145261 RepID=UPI0024B35286|nr:hypothetical protein [Methanothermobacter wolfeii]MDI6701790.1 hypothetical protein [Methanothermobacter wolfeii]MDI6841235.1 hypothetical protein [Methanothermobacter wolfeii]